MLDFGNDHIITGYIKQLLASFNLPKYRVYTQEDKEYANTHNGEEKYIIPTIKKTNITNSLAGNTYTYNTDLLYSAYIKDDHIFHYIDGKWRDCWLDYDYTDLDTLHHHVYYFNKFELNRTKTFQIKNNIYDSYTHEYLGDFLRFQRDYLNIDLMPLYNCFNNEICNNLDLTFKPNQTTTEKVVSFSSYDQSYKIYALPIKLFKKYTVAIDCAGQLEMCCGVYGDYFDSEGTLKNLPEKTYIKLHNTRFNQPFLYSPFIMLPTELNVDGQSLQAGDLKLSSAMIQEIAQKEKYLKLFIKVPVNNKSTITILEGDYLRWNDRQFVYKKEGNQLYQNKYITNHRVNATATKSAAVLQDDCYNRFKPITNLQLLQFNTGKSHPFADRLIEYLMGNAVTSVDKISDNVKRVQKTMAQNGMTYKYYGAWDNKIKAIAYDYMNEKSYNLTTNHDILGYIDSDVEKNYMSTSASISKIDIYEDN